MGPLKYKAAVCASLGSSVAMVRGQVVGGIVTGVCSAVFSGTVTFCAGLKFKLDNYCTPLPKTLGLKVRAYGLFGSVPDVGLSRTQEGPAPSPLALQGTIDVPWDSKCRNTYTCDCHCNSVQNVYSAWTQVYLGINYSAQIESPYYRQTVEPVTNSSVAAGVAACKGIADLPKYADSTYDTVLWYDYVNFYSVIGDGASYYGSICVLPQLDILGPGDMTFNRDASYYDDSRWAGTSLQVFFVNVLPILFNGRYANVTTMEDAKSERSAWPWTNATTLFVLLDLIKIEQTYECACDSLLAVR